MKKYLIKKKQIPLIIIYDNGEELRKYKLKPCYNGGIKIIRVI